MKQHSRAHPVQSGTMLMQGLGNRLVDTPSPRLDRTACEDVAGACLSNQFADDGAAVAAAEQQGTAPPDQRPPQCHQTVMQPPPRGAALRPGAGRLFIEDEDRQDGAAAVDRGMQRGMVRQPQVITEPQDRRHVGGSGHAAKVGAVPAVSPRGFAAGKWYGKGRRELDRPRPSSRQ